VYRERARVEREGWGRRSRAVRRVGPPGHPVMIAPLRHLGLGWTFPAHQGAADGHLRTGSEA
jgi:hypothetical protein